MMAGHEPRAVSVNLILMLLVVLLIGSVIALTIKEIHETASETTMFVSSSSIAVTVNQTFEVNIEVSDVADLYGWEFKLSWNPSLLEAINITENSFLKNGADTYIVSKMSNNDGYVLAGCTRLRNVTGASGNGTVATIEFRTKEEGTCTLNLYDTKLVNSNKQLMAHTNLDGTVHVLLHDVAILNITSSKTIVGQGLNTKINITVENHGETSETFNITIYANTTIIDTITNITLTNGTSTTLTLTWNTTGIAKGNYTITAKATPIPYETDMEDNTLIDGWVFITIPGDINADQKVNILDCIILANHFGHTNGNGHAPSTKEWMACLNSDINNDNRVNILDCIILAGHFGEKDP